MPPVLLERCAPSRDPILGLTRSLGDSTSEILRWFLRSRTIHVHVVLSRLLVGLCGRCNSGAVAGSAGVSLEFLDKSTHVVLLDSERSVAVLQCSWSWGILFPFCRVSGYGGHKRFVRDLLVPWPSVTRAVLGIVVRAFGCVVRGRRSLCGTSGDLLEEFLDLL